MRLVQLITFALPWIALPGVADPYLEPKAVFLMGGVWLMVLWYAGVGRVLVSQNPLTRWVAGYLLLLGIIHFHWAYLQRTPEQSQVVYNVYTWLPTLTVLGAILAVRTMASLFSGTRTAQLFTQWMCLSAALSAGYVYCQAVGLDQWYVQPEQAPIWASLTGSFGNPEYLTVYLALLLPLCLLFNQKRYLVYGGLLVGVLMMVKIPGAWVIGTIGMLTYGFVRLWSRWTEKWFRVFLGWGMAILCVAGLCFLWTHWQGDERWPIWKEAWGLVQARHEGVPRLVDSFTGRGLGAYSLIMAKTEHIWVHNEWLEGLVEVGVIGVGLILAMVIRITIRGWKRASSSLLDAGWFSVWIAFLCASCVFPVAHWAHTAWIGLCAWAVLEREEGV